MDNDTMIEKTNAWMGCRCCECQGKHCMIPHPGHSCGGSKNMVWNDGTVPGITATVYDRPSMQNMEGITANIRKFDSGATRDTDVGKLDYEGFDSPLVNKRYAQYMHQHRKQSDGSLRAADNWQKGIPKEAYMSSLVRHMEDVKLIWDGYPEEAVDSDMESVLCAVLFNVKGLLFELLKDKKR